MNQKDVPEAESANPSSEKMTTIARVIGLKGMPKGKTLVGSFSQPRDHRLPKENKEKTKNKIKKTTHAKYGAFTFIIANCKTKTIQGSNSKQITFTDYTILNACQREMSPALPHTQHFLSEGDLGLKLVPRLWYGALRVRPVNEL